MKDEVMPRKTVEDPSLKAARQARYLAKPRTKQRLKIYNKKQNATPKARAARAAYNKSPKGRIACKLANLRCLKMKRDFVQAEKLRRGCVDCGYRANAAAMDFDHVRGTKKFVLSNFSQSLAAIKKEMAKCEVRCALCHRIKTHADSLKRSLKRSARLKANKERSEKRVDCGGANAYTLSGELPSPRRGRPASGFAPPPDRKARQPITFE